MNEYLRSALREGRINKGLKQSDVAKLIGMKGGTLSNYENGISEPDIDTFATLCDIYGLDFAYVLGEAYGLPLQDSSELNIRPSEVELIKKYRELSSHGKELVDIVLDNEYKYLKQQNAIPLAISRIVPYYFKIASAGTGQIIFDTPPTKSIEIPIKYKNVDYAIGVNGDSMSPDFKDGDTLLVQMTSCIKTGEIGIFQVNGECYVKKLGNGELISINKEYDNVILNDTSTCLGRVVDKL